MITPDSTDWVRRLGSTSLSVTAVAVGGAPLGSMPENFGHEVSYADGVALAEHVLDSPVRVLDTANGYSGGESERRIGAAIARHGGLPADFLVTTKVDARGRDYSGARVRASVAESKERLGLDHLPLVFLHDPEYHDFAELSRSGGAVDTLKALRDEGEIGHVGLAGGGLDARSDRDHQLGLARPPARGPWSAPPVRPLLAGAYQRLAVAAPSPSPAS